VKTYVDTFTKSKASAYRSATQAIDHGTWTKVQLNNESYDVLSEFDSVTNYRFVASAAGYYMVFGQVTLSVAMADAIRLITRIYKNGSYVLSTDKSTGKLEDVNQNISGILSLAANDYLELWFNQSSGVSKDILKESGDTFMTVHRLS